ncbi:MAG TPA: hypothetical protein PLB91_02335 [Spirochaetales bacterium]|nr:hypothetical protein [Spirochaetales bacterium]HRY53124.1 CDP-glycerol--glycerophosphate glycerophosphotransferase [Spirochaetia bacterium]HRZ64659.1 CDP-glycerol--glycerophosphate glycerophosphotransferase [Spirochaetia bacterium]
MKKADALFRGRGYSELLAYDEARDEYIDIARDLRPDLLFYTNPYKGLIDDRYYIDRFRSTLTCYVPYSFFATDDRKMYDSQFFNSAWRVFCETDYHEREIASVQRRRGRNVVSLGYPGCDAFANGSNVAIPGPWRPDASPRKHLIWAPHWLPLETFLRDAMFFLELAKDYESVLQIALKPHPLLCGALEKVPGWGVEAAQAYFESWRSSASTILVEGDYTDLFLTSDALVHNSGSFLSEYLVTRKPALFIGADNEYMVNGSKYSAGQIKWNAYGKDAIAKHYIAASQDQIRSFIERVVLSGDDYMKNQRNEFVDHVILRSGGGSSSERIVGYIKDELGIA